VVVPAEGGAFRVTGRLDTLAVPDSLYALLSARLDALDPQARGLAGVAAVVGGTFPAGALVAVSGRPEPEVSGALAELVHRDVLVVAADPLSPRHAGYRFSQDPLRQVAYETLTRRERKQLHLAVAGHLRSVSSGDAEVVARHYLDARRRAAGLWERSAGAAMVAGDHDAASVAVEEAVAAYRDAGDERAAAGASVRAGAAFRLASRHVDARRRLTGNLAALRAEPAADTVECLVELAVLEAFDGNLTAAEGLAVEALRLAQDLGVPDPLLADAERAGIAGQPPLSDLCDIVGSLCATARAGPPAAEVDDGTLAGDRADASGGGRGSVEDLATGQLAAAVRCAAAGDRAGALSAASSAVLSVGELGYAHFSVRWAWPLAARLASEVGDAARTEMLLEGVGSVPDGHLPPVLRAERELDAGVARRAARVRSALGASRASGRVFAGDAALGKHLFPMTERPRPAVPYRYERSASAAELRSAHRGLPPGAETGKVVSVAGRLMGRRDQGRIAFGELRDSSGAIQLFAGAKWTDDFDGFVALDRGDWIGATGEVVATRTGELSVKVDRWVLLAEARRSFGDKWHGITDPDLRYRQRYADLWANEGSRDTFLARSAMISLTRRFMENRGFVEVETPVLHAAAGGATAKPFTTHHNALDLDLNLRIALELHLKRLVVGGIEAVFEIGRVFRNEGLSPRHNPEFTMLEAYQAYADYGDMMELVEQLVAHLATELTGTTTLSYGGRPLDLSPPWRRATMLSLIAEHAGFEVDLDTPTAELVRLAAGCGVAVEEHWGPGKLIVEIYEKTTEPLLWDPVFVMDHPKEVSPLARDHRSVPGLVERFEGIVAGRELCNAFSELCDPDEQRRTFEDQARAKAAGDEEAMVVDEDYLRALEFGLPPTGGVGIGMDRLAMVLTGAETIRDVILFPTLRPEQV